MTQTLAVATRRSLLALTQTRAFIDLLKRAYPGLEVTELLVTTTGDVILDRPLAEVGGKGLFVKEIELALLERRADFAVHSMKDVPAEVAEGLTIAAIPWREDPRDVAISRDGVLIEHLPKGARIGTSSLRRQVQLASFRSDLEYLPLRGNVDTRIRRCHEGVVDAILLAAAGLSRLGWLDRVTEFLPVERCLPAAGQGALAIECRSDDTSTSGLLAPLHHPETALRVAAERGVQRAIGGGVRCRWRPMPSEMRKICGCGLCLPTILGAYGGQSGAFCGRRTRLRRPGWVKKWDASCSKWHELP
jgi:hydroxymethylbilane synthase